MYYISYASLTPLGNMSLNLLTGADVVNIFKSCIVMHMIQAYVKVC